MIAQNAARQNVNDDEQPDPIQHLFNRPAKRRRQSDCAKQINQVRVKFDSLVGSHDRFRLFAAVGQAAAVADVLRPQSSRRIFSVTRSGRFALIVSALRFGARLSIWDQR